MSFLKEIPNIKEHYSILTPIINEIGFLHGGCRWVSPYSSLVNWPAIMTPIEDAAWQTIRGFGKAPLYPQYPIDKYFVDFGNPYTRIAVECDGKDYHLDKEKDHKRDLELSKKGWLVYRISGSDCCTPVNPDYYDRREEDSNYHALVKEYYENTLEGLITAIGIWHYGYTCYDERIEEEWIAKNVLHDRVSIPRRSTLKRINEL